jgi:hypothetical protein
MHSIMLGLLVSVVVAGCAPRKSSLLLERFPRGLLTDALSVGQPIELHVSPQSQTKSQAGVDVTIQHAHREFLDTFFSNQELFGPYAGRNPYYREHLVFHVTVANTRATKIHLNPAEFKLIDDRGNQLDAIGLDYITAFAEYRQPVASVTRGVIEEARPGYFGLSFPVGKFLAQRPQWRFALLKQSSLQPGYLYPGVAHDGLIAFWNPSIHATKLTMMIANIKTDFSAQDEPQTSLEFVFEFDVSHP